MALWTLKRTGRWAKWWPHCGGLTGSRSASLFTDVLRCRREGILILSGGLLVHNLRDMSSFSEVHANSLVKEFHQAILDAITIADVRTHSCLAGGRIMLTHMMDTARRKEAGPARLDQPQRLPCGTPKSRSFCPFVRCSWCGRQQFRCQGGVCYLRGSDVCVRLVT